ncbi:hypothetical protein PoB_001326000 [Plakobranchus ocellatus]|uniref:Uncharacterized protein n=1 Tax=Plakobranchus ocellatus TaxID=259542 RepID=A0AAV3YWC1_9GAST|nr:hypothetical protein PoB_001326000 [Plakobranchus ocellatus]
MLCTRCEAMAVHNKVIKASRPSVRLVAGLERATERSLQISGQIRYTLCHQRPVGGIVDSGLHRLWTVLHLLQTPQALDCPTSAVDSTGSGLSYICCRLYRPVLHLL